MNQASHYLFVTGFRESGLFRYRYDPTKDSYTQSNNELRQLMGSKLLAEFSADDSTLLLKHRKNLEFILTYWYREENGVGFIFYDNKSKLGANAMALRALVYSPYFEEHRQKALMLAQGMLGLRNPDGSFRPWLKEPGYEFDADYLMTFYSGEAILALLEYAEKVDNPSILEAARGSQDFYLDKYVVHLEENYYPAYVPWHSQSLSRLYRKTNDRRYADAVLALNDKLLELQDTKENIGRFHDPAQPQYGSPHASSDAVYTEGLAYALEIARSLNDVPHTKRYSEALELALRHLMSLQYTVSNASGLAQPNRALGGFRVSSTDPRIRMDSVQHTIDAFKKALEVLE